MRVLRTIVMHVEDEEASVLEGAASLKKTQAVMAASLNGSRPLGSAAESRNPRIGSSLVAWCYAIAQPKAS